jgi:hypothetical protein
MIIFDFRDNTIKNIKREDLFYLAPELYMYIRPVERNNPLNHLVRYEYKLRGGKKIIWNTSPNKNMKSVPFKVREDSFLENNNIDRSEIIDIKRYWYIDNEEMQKWV